jgi:hypothetical protein
MTVRENMLKLWAGEQNIRISLGHVKHLHSEPVHSVLSEVAYVGLSTLFPQRSDIGIVLAV